MKVPVSWLREYVDFGLSAGELADALMMTGTAVESITEITSENKGVFTGLVESVEKHPNADKLSVCKVLLKGKEHTVVCGAPNVKRGIKVLVALPGAVLKGGFEIGRRSIRGIESDGMICSETELGIEEDASGIMILPDDTPLDMELDDALGLKDMVIDFEITPNRPDCMSIVGIAREVSAITGSKLRMPDISFSESRESASTIVNIEVKDVELCPRYIGMGIKNVTIGASPLWMRQRLAAAGMRPINNAVDVTNYVLLETGQPLHAFDWEKLSGGKIIVRRASKNEKIVTLDGVGRELDDSRLVIADEKSAVAIAGVMGSENSEVWKKTNTILLESAYFNPQSIMQTARSLSLLTESAARFERGIDPNNTEFAAKRTAKLLAELCGGTVLKGMTDVYPKKMKPWTVKLRPQRVNDILGTNLDNNKIAGRLKSLQLDVVADKEIFDVNIPTFRQDLTREVDLIEEIARLERYDSIASSLPKNDGSQGGLTGSQKLVKQIGQVLVSNGLFEVVTYSFGFEEDISNLKLPENDPRRKFIQMENPLSEDQAILRTSLLPGLMRVAKHNFSRNIDFVSIYEVGHIFLANNSTNPPLVKGETGGFPGEKTELGILIGGVPPKEWWGEGKQPDFYTVKAIIEDILEKLNISKYEIQRSADSLFHPGKSADVAVQGKKICSFGFVNPAILNNFDVDSNMLYAEIDIESLINSAGERSGFKEIPRYPSIDRDLAILAPEDMTFAAIEELIKSIGSELLESVRLFDLYKGPNIPEDKKSLAYSLVFRASDRTLKDDEVDPVIRDIISALQKQGLSIR